MISYHITSLILGLIIASLIILLIRKDLLHTRYSLMWFGFAIATAVFGSFPQLNDWIARRLGVHYAPILFVVAGMGVMLIKMLSMDIDRSRLEQNMRRLNEKIAILEGEKLLELHNFKNHINTNNDNDDDDDDD